jgi:hypothetical protein
MRMIGRSLDDLPPVASLGRPAWAPLAVAALGLLVAMAFALLLTLGPPPASLSTPRQSVIFSEPVRGH